MAALRTPAQLRQTLSALRNEGLVVLYGGKGATGSVYAQA